MDIHGAIPTVEPVVWVMKRYHPIYWVEHHDIQTSAEFIRRRETSMFEYYDPDRENYIKKHKTPSAAYSLQYQLVFSVKYRKALLQEDNIAADFISLVRNLGDEKGYHIFGIKIQPEHVHIVAGLRPDHSISQMVKDIKGRSSRLLRQKYPDLTTIRNLWTSGYSVDSLGEKNIAQIISYLQRQDEHHGGKSFAE